MSIPRIVNALGYIDDDLICDAQTYLPKKKKTIWLQWGALAAAVCVVLLVAIPWGVQEEQPNTSSGTLWGAEEIYPTVAVQGELYEWRRGAAICAVLPDTCVYYGEIAHVEGDVPKNDCEFVSVFTLTGQIYIDAQDDTVIYLCMTTSWMENTVVAFDLVETE